MNEDRKPRQFFEARPDGGKARERPRVTYREMHRRDGEESNQKHGGS